MKPFDVRSILYTSTKATIRLSTPKGTEPKVRKLVKLTFTEGYTADDIRPVIYADSKGQIDESRLYRTAQTPQRGIENLAFLFRLYRFVMAVNPYGNSDKLKVGSLVYDQGRTLAVKNLLKTSVEVVDIETGEVFYYQLRGYTFIMDPITASIYTTLVHYLGRFFPGEYEDPLDGDIIEPLFKQAQIKAASQIAIEGAINGKSTAKIVKTIENDRKLGHRADKIKELVSSLDLGYRQQREQAQQIADEREERLARQQEALYGKRRS